MAYSKVGVLKPGDQHVMALLRALLRLGETSRAELARYTGLRPNTVGGVVESMVRAGWISEAAGQPDSAPPARGRPAVRLSVDPAGREVLGLALAPHRVRAARMNLLGQPLGEARECAVDTGATLVRQAAELVSELAGPRTLAIGVSSPGLVDEAEMRLLFSSTAPDAPGLSLGEVLRAAGELPVALENDVHALGDRWRISTGDIATQTVLLVSLADGAVGASLMIGGRAADGGCVRGGNELGHLQVHCGDRAVPTCYCGQPRCVERVFSTEMLRKLAGGEAGLASRLETALANGLNPDGLGMSGAPAPTAEGWIAGRLAEAVANVVNLVRPHRVVWVGDGEISRVMPALTPVLTQAVTHALLPVLRERVDFESWLPHAAGQDSCVAVTAGSLGVAILTGQRAPASGVFSLRPQPATP